MQTWYDEHRHELSALTHEANQRAREADRADQDHKRDVYNLRCRPMSERIKNLIDTMPDDERCKPRHMEFFRQLLKAKFVIRGRGDRASVSEIGPALKSLGWTRQRVWLGPEQTYRTLWFPPED
jgi:hypothetical protein